VRNTKFLFELEIILRLLLKAFSPGMVNDTSVRIVSPHDAPCDQFPREGGEAAMQTAGWSKKQMRDAIVA
jgi:hypothetical protein